MQDQPDPRVRVWDPLLRILHWLLAATMIAAWVTGHWSLRNHETLGYMVAGIVLVRVIWGFTGPLYARFRQFIRSPKRTWQYTRQLLAKSEPRHLGHNPLGGWMVLALLGCAGLLFLTGFLYTTDWLYGYAWLEALHRWLAWSLIVLVPLHLAGVLFTSLRHRENLVMAMFTGKKRTSSLGD